MKITKSKHTLTIIIVTFVIVSISSIPFASVIAQQPSIPEWIKNNAKWWAEGTITESDYVSGLQYLISQGIINVPIKQVVAVSTNLSDDERAQSMVVRMIMPDKTYTYNTFSRLSVFGQTISQSSGTQVPQSFFGSPQFQLESLPSKDKKIFYKLVSDYVSQGKELVQPFDLEIDIIAGDGTIIETLVYGDCEVTGYWVYSSYNKDEYPFGEKDESEIRDVSNFLCTGFELKVP